MTARPKIFAGILVASNFILQPSQLNPVTDPSPSARLTHLVHEAFRNTCRKNLAGVARSIQKHETTFHISSACLSYHSKLMRVRMT
jgi:hypothetical protein